MKTLLADPLVPRAGSWRAGREPALTRDTQMAAQRQLGSARLRAGAGRTSSPRTTDAERKLPGVNAKLWEAALAAVK